MAQDKYNCCFSFWAILSQQPKNQNFKIMKKNAWRCHHFPQVYQKLLDDVRFLRYGVRETDGQTDKKSDT